MATQLNFTQNTSSLKEKDAGGFEWISEWLKTIIELKKLLKFKKLLKWPENHAATVSHDKTTMVV